MQATDKRKLGKSGITTTLMGLGGAPLGDLYEVIPEERALGTIQAAYDLGIRLFDTAPLYGKGVSEHRFGAVLRQHPEDRANITLSTKVGRYMLPEQREKVDRSVFKGGLDFRLVVDYGYDGTMRALEQSHHRLGMNQIDVVHIHDCDVATWGPEGFEQRFREAADGAYKALYELREQGVIKAIGVGVNDIMPLLRFAAIGDFDTFMLAGRYTLLEHAALDELLPLCQKRGIGIMTAGALQFRYPRHRRQAWSNLQLQACPAGDPRQSGSHRSDLRAPWRSAGGGGDTVPARTSGGSQHGARRGPLRRGRSQHCAHRASHSCRLLGRTQARRPAARRRAHALTQRLQQAKKAPSRDGAFL
jgi:aryl-alcohol dehydrogenase-like predicted oxidoreductase